MQLQDNAQRWLKKGEYARAKPFHLEACRQVAAKDPQKTVFWLADGTFEVVTLEEMQRSPKEIIQMRILRERSA